MCIATRILGNGKGGTTTGKVELDRVGKSTLVTGHLLTNQNMLFDGVSIDLTGKSRGINPNGLLNLQTT